MDCRECGSHERGVYPTQNSSRSGWKVIRLRELHDRKIKKKLSRETMNVNNSNRGARYLEKRNVSMKRKV